MIVFTEEPWTAEDHSVTRTTDPISGGEAWLASVKFTQRAETGISERRAVYSAFTVEHKFGHRPTAEDWIRSMTARTKLSEIASTKRL